MKIFFSIIFSWWKLGLFILLMYKLKNKYYRISGWIPVVGLRAGTQQFCHPQTRFCQFRVGRMLDAPAASSDRFFPQFGNPDWKKLQWCTPPWAPRYHIADNLTRLRNPLLHVHYFVCPNKNNLTYTINSSKKCLTTWMFTQENIRNL